MEKQDTAMQILIEFTGKEIERSGSADVALMNIRKKMHELKSTTKREQIEELEKLRAFKKHVHDRLDAMGIEEDPESEHKLAGCRIGGQN